MGHVGLERALDLGRAAFGQHPQDQPVFGRAGLELDLAPPLLALVELDHRLAVAHRGHHAGAVLGGLEVMDQGVAVGGRHQVGQDQHRRRRGAAARLFGPQMGGRQGVNLQQVFGAVDERAVHHPAGPVQHQGGRAVNLFEGPGRSGVDRLAAGAAAAVDGLGVGQVLRR